MWVEIDAKFGIASARQIILMGSTASTALSRFTIPGTMVHNVSIFESSLQFRIIMLFRAGHPEGVMIKLLPFLKSLLEIDKTKREN